MIESTVIGALVGGLFRLAPELLKYLDRHLERLHELAMQQVMLQFEEKRPDGYKYAEMALTGAEVSATIDAIREAQKEQFNTGNKKLDAVSILVRPAVTYVLVALYVVVKIVMLGAAVASGAPLAGAYTADDLAFLSGITVFWFMGRPLEKRA